jgi:hypothetical protein
MTVVPIPKRPHEAFNPNRPVSSLLKTQILHLREAEKMFPPKYRSGTYINAIKTEGEAAKYIRYVTSTLHMLHGASDGVRVAAIAAAAEPARKSKTRTRSKAKSKNKSKNKAKNRKKRS